MAHIAIGEHIWLSSSAFSTIKHLEEVDGTITIFCSAPEIIEYEDRLLAHPELISKVLNLDNFSLTKHDPYNRPKHHNKSYKRNRNRNKMQKESRKRNRK